VPERAAGRRGGDPAGAASFTYAALLSGAGVVAGPGTSVNLCGRPKSPGVKSIVTGRLRGSAWPIREFSLCQSESCDSQRRTAERRAWTVGYSPAPSLLRADQQSFHLQTPCRLFGPTGRIVLAANHVLSDRNSGMWRGRPARWQTLHYRLGLGVHGRGNRRPDVTWPKSVHSGQTLAIFGRSGHRPSRRTCFDLARRRGRGQIGAGAPASWAAPVGHLLAPWTASPDYSSAGGKASSLSARKALIMTLRKMLA
jgi:hypothetical protein